MLLWRPAARAILVQHTHTHTLPLSLTRTSHTQTHTPSLSHTHPLSHSHSLHEPRPARPGHRYDFANYSSAELAVILRHEVAAGGFALEAGITDAAAAGLIEAGTSPELRAAMNGGLARQLFRKARGHLDGGLSLDASPAEMCTLLRPHLERALRDMAESLRPPPQSPTGGAAGGEGRGSGRVALPPGRAGT